MGKIIDWHIDLGIIPGILFGIRSYYDPEIYKMGKYKVRQEGHVIYILCFDIMLKLWTNAE